MEQFVIMFNDYPEEVCAPGTTEEQADARATEIKERYYHNNYGPRWRDLKGLNTPRPVYVRACCLRVWQPNTTTPTTNEEQNNG